MFAVGILEGPLHHYYYVYLDKIFPGMDLRTVSIKVLLDQIIASPLFIGTFFYGMGAFEGKTFFECTEEIRSKIWAVLLVMLQQIKF